MKMQKIKFKFSSQFKHFIWILALTISIVGAGIGAPMLLLWINSMGPALPSDSVNIEDIQPYGSDIITMENVILSNINFYSMLYVYDNGTAVDDIMNGVSDAESFTISTDNGFSNLGSKHPGAYTDNRREVLSIIWDKTQETFRGSLPTTLPCYVVEFPGDSRSGIMMADGNNNFGFIDQEYGLPISLNMNIISEGYGSLDDYWNFVKETYSDAMGIEFMPNALYSNEFSQDGYDVYYYNEAKTPDGKLTLSLYVTGGWYWTGPEFEGDDWHPTDSYTWNVAIELSDW